MAGSRLEKIGTIFSRTAGLLRSGAMKYQDRPVWYDIYRVFPPKYEPHIERQPTTNVEDIPDILYKEDTVRAEFFKHFGLNPDAKPRKLNDSTYEDPSQEFLNKYNEIKKIHPHWSLEKLFETASEGVQYLPRSSAIKKDSSSADERRRPRRLSRINREYREENEDFDPNPTLSLEEQEDGNLGRKRIPLITAESLRSLFEEAKHKQDASTSTPTSVDDLKNLPSKDS